MRGGYATISKDRNQMLRMDLLSVMQKVVGQVVADIPEDTSEIGRAHV